MSSSLTKKIAIGYVWNLASKWINRSIGIISTLILVRLLEPTDFGIAALASIAMALFTMLSEVGAEKYVIKSEKCDDELLNSAWSLNIVLKVIAGLGLALLSGQIAVYLNEPLLREVLLVCSLIPIIGAFKNIGIAKYERELNYRPLTKLAVSTKLIVFPITITLAFWWQSYWALVIGNVVSELIVVVYSYRLHPYRPCWSSKQWNQQWIFSKWMLMSTLSGYIRSRIDSLLLGRFLPSSDVGTYRVSQEFAWLPFSELISPATSSLYAGISRISHNQDKLHDKIAHYLIFSYLCVIPASLGIFTLNEELVSVVIGEKWQAAAPILGFLSLLMLSMPLNVILQVVLISLTKIKYMVVLDIIMITAIISSFVILNQSNIQDLLIYTQIRVSLVVLFIFLLGIVYKKVLNFSIKRLLTVCLLPLGPGIVMLWVLNLQQLSFSSDVISLLVKILFGIIVFTSVMFVTLYLTRRSSEDIEYVIIQLSKVWGKLVKKS